MVDTARSSERLTASLRTRGADETRRVAAALARVALPADRIALVGRLGAGKTQFAKGFAAGLGVTDVVNSPSFTLMAEYAGRLPLFHLDLYRLNGPDDALGGGLLDERQVEGVTLMEWATRLGEGLDQDRLEIHLEIEGDEDRLLTLHARGDGYRRYLEAAQRFGGAPA